MKQLLLALLVLPASLYAQSLPLDKAGRITFTEVVEAQGRSQKELLDKAKKIVTNIFASTRENKIIETPGSLVFKGYAFYHLDKIGIELPYFFNFTLHFSFEDGKYKYSTTDFVDDEGVSLEKGLLNPIEIYNNDGEVKPESKEDFDAIIKGLKNVGEVLKAMMAASPSPKS